MSADPAMGAREPLRALSLHQPQASLMALRAKRIETRSWTTNYRGLVAIHAARKLPPKDLMRIGDWHVGYELTVDRLRVPFITDTRLPLAPVHWLPLGAVVAVGELVDVVPITRSPRLSDCPVMEATPFGDLKLWTKGGRCLIDSDQLPYGDFAPGRFAWLFEDVRELREPVPVRGRQGLFTLPEDTAEAVRAAR